MKKKTFVFDEQTLKILEELKTKLNKKEVQIVEEALRIYHEYIVLREGLYGDVKKISENFLEIINKIEDLSYRLGKCEAEREMLIGRTKNEKKGV
ncbi:hypothetical protein [Aquifex aeolicus]|uniref:hypothetical protein n=1 Tax=Aquifex aeolicus TaxID=63363 RepID=UPI0002F32269|nr:hypothetical protein [Aquifex aeolicus]